MRKSFILLATILPLNIALIACSETTTEQATTVDSAAEATASATGDAITLRQDMMKNWRDASDIMGDMIDNPDTFDVAVFREQAQFLANDAGNAWQHFANQVDKGDATDAVWNNPEEFTAKAQSFEAVAANLSAAAQMATQVSEVESAYGELKNSCKACHQTFKD